MNNVIKFADTAAFSAGKDLIGQPHVIEVTDKGFLIGTDATYNTVLDANGRTSAFVIDDPEGYKPYASAFAFSTQMTNDDGTTYNAYGAHVKIDAASYAEWVSASAGESDYNKAPINAKYTVKLYDDEGTQTGSGIIYIPLNFPMGPDSRHNGYFKMYAVMNGAVVGECDRCFALEDKDSTYLVSHVYNVDFNNFGTFFTDVEGWTNPVVSGKVRLSLNDHVDNSKIWILPYTVDEIKNGDSSFQ